MKTIEAFETVDGRKFFDEVAAQEHEKSLRPTFVPVVPCKRGSGSVDYHGPESHGRYDAWLFSVIGHPEAGSYDGAKKSGHTAMLYLAYGDWYDQDGKPIRGGYLYCNPAGRSNDSH